MKVTPFRAYSRSECSQAAALLAPVVQGWSRRWFGQQASVAGFRNVAGPQDGLLLQALELPEPALLCGDFDAGWFVPVVAEADHSAELTQLMLHLGPDTDTDTDTAGEDCDLLARLKRDMTCNCLRDLGTILSGEQLDDTGPSFRDWEITSLLKRAFMVGGGWAVLSISCAGLAVDVLIGPAAIASILPPPEPLRMVGQLTPARQAIVDQSTRLTASLGGTSLTIGQFEKLRQGDVIKLDQLVADPVRLVTASGSEVAWGQLGSKQGCKAIRLG